MVLINIIFVILNSILFLIWLPLEVTAQFLSRSQFTVFQVGNCADFYANILKGLTEIKNRMNEIQTFPRELQKKFDVAIKDSLKDLI